MNFVVYEIEVFVDFLSQGIVISLFFISSSSLLFSIQYSAFLPRTNPFEEVTLCLKVVVVPKWQNIFKCESFEENHGRYVALSFPMSGSKRIQRITQQTQTSGCTMPGDSH